MLHAVAESHALERVRGLVAPLPGRHPRVDQRQLDVVQRVRPGEQVERLEDEPDLLVADAGQFIVGQIAHLLAVEPVLAAGGRIEAADEVHERGFPRPGRAHDRHELVLLDLDFHAAQGVHDLATHVVIAGQLVGQDQDFRQRRVAGAERHRLGAGHRECPRSASSWARAMR